MLEVRRLRLAREWNQTELAYHAGLAPSVISQIENGKRDPTARTLRKLAEALGVEVGDLFQKGQATLWSDEKPLRRQTFGYVDARQGLDAYCADWERRIEEGGLDDCAIEDFMDTALALLPVTDIAAQHEVSELARAAGHVPSEDEQKRKELLAQSEIRKANGRYVVLFAKVGKALASRIEEATNEPSPAETNVVRLQEVRDRVMDVQKRAAG